MDQDIIALTKQNLECRELKETITLEKSVDWNLSHWKGHRELPNYLPTTKSVY